MKTIALPSIGYQFCSCRMRGRGRGSIKLVVRNPVGNKDSSSLAPLTGANRGDLSNYIIPKRYIPSIGARSGNFYKSYSERKHRDQPKTLDEPAEKRRKVEMNREKYQPTWQNKFLKHSNPSIRAHHDSVRKHQDQPKTLDEPVDKKRKFEMTREKPQPAWQEEVTELNFKDLKNSLDKRLATGSPPGSIVASPLGSPFPGPFACYSGSFCSNHSGSRSGSPKIIRSGSHSSSRSRSHSSSHSRSRSRSRSRSPSRSHSRSPSRNHSRSPMARSLGNSLGSPPERFTGSPLASGSGSCSDNCSGSLSVTPIASPQSRKQELEELKDQLSKVKDKLIQYLKDSLDKSKTEATDAKIEKDVLRRILYSKESEKARARTLEQENNQLLLTVAALEESNSKMKIEIVNLKENFEQTKNTLEDNSKFKSRKNLEDSAAKLKKLRNLMAAKVYLIDPIDEDLEMLQTIEIEKLFLKYEKATMVKDSFKERYEGTRETLSDVKTKLKLKTEMNVSLENQLNEIMDILNIPGKNRSFVYILPAIQHLVTQNLKNDLGSEQEETEHYTNATALIHSTTDTAH